MNLQRQMSSILAHKETTGGKEGEEEKEKREEKKEEGEEEGGERGGQVKVEEKILD